MQTNCPTCKKPGVQVEIRAADVAIRVCENRHKWITNPEPIELEAQR